MRHRVAHRKLGRVTEHRISMLRNQATALLRHEHLTTTVPRAKELRPFVERIITIAIERCASGHVQSSTSCLITLPSEACIPPCAAAECGNAIPNWAYT